MLTDEQKALRLTGFAASEFAALCDLYPASWKNRRGPGDVIREKLEGDAFTGSPRTERGEWLEEPIALRWAAESRRAISRNTRTLRHPSIEWVLATPDYYVSVDEILEVKLVSFFVAKHWASGPPNWVQAQTQIQMAVSGTKRAYVAALLEGDREFAGPRTYAVDYRPEIFDQLVIIARPHWDRVLAARAERERSVSNG